MLSIVVCTLDFKKALESIKELKKYYKCIIVSPEYIKEKINNVLFLKDIGNSLGQARNIGAEKVITPYLLYMSDDNIISKKQIDEQLEYLIDHGYSYLGFLTRIENPKGYWNKCLNMRWIKRFYEGHRYRVGMPCIIETKLVKQIKFIDGFCDDITFCGRLNEIGFAIGYSNVEIYEDNWTYKDLKKRFEMYGKSDRKYYDDNKKFWTLKHKIYIFLRVIIDEWQWNPYFWLFYLFILWNRYKIRIFGYKEKKELPKIIDLIPNSYIDYVKMLAEKWSNFKK